MKSTQIISLVEVTIEDDNARNREVEVARLKQMAGNYGATMKYCIQGEGSTTIGFKGNNPEILKVLLSN